MSLNTPGGTGFSGPVRVKDASGNEVEVSANSTTAILKIGGADLGLQATVTAAVGTTDGTGDAVPTSAQAYLDISVGGTAYVIPLFKKA